MFCDEHNCPRFHCGCVAPVALDDEVSTPSVDVSFPEVEPKVAALTIAVARRQFQDEFVSGEEVFCPVCDRRSHIDGRPFDSSFARALNLLRHRDDERPGGFIVLASELNAFGLNRGNVATMMRHWGVIEPKEAKDDGTDKHGEYRITNKGRQFLEGVIEIPLMAYTHQGKLFAVSDRNNPFENGREEYIHISAVNGFDYDEMFLR